MIRQLMISLRPEFSQSEMAASFWPGMPGMQMLKYKRDDITSCVLIQVGLAKQH